MKIGSEEGLRELNVLLGPMESAMLTNLNKCNNFTTMKNLEYIFLVFLFLLRVQGFGQAIRGVKPLNSANVMPNRNYGIVIGISDYKNIPDLQYADRDAMAFGKFLSQISIPIVDSSNLMIYINDAANRINVCDGISKLIKSFNLATGFIFTLQDMETSKHSVRQRMDYSCYMTVHREIILD